jgi:hypothetical protein
MSVSVRLFLRVLRTLIKLLNVKGGFNLADKFGSLGRAIDERFTAIPRKHANKDAS